MFQIVEVNSRICSKDFSSSELNLQSYVESKTIHTHTDVCLYICIRSTYKFFKVMRGDVNAHLIMSQYSDTNKKKKCISVMGNLPW